MNDTNSEPESLLQVEFEKLKKLYDQTQNDVETKNQQLYNYERELNRLTCLENEYVQEIETLQSAEKEAFSKYEAKLQSCEVVIGNLKLELGEYIDSMKLQLDAKNIEIEELHIQLKQVQDNTDSETNVHEDLVADNARLTDYMEKLMQNIEDLTADNENLQKQNVSANETILGLTNESNDLLERYMCKEQELFEANSLIQSLQEDAVLARSEMDSLRSKPLDVKSQGNSLFAEVDDKRLQLQQTIADMKVRCREMQREKTHCLRQISDLHLQVATLCQRWDDEVKERQNYGDRVEESYKSHIDTLESLLSTYKQELSKRQTLDANGIEGCVVDFVETMTNTKNKEIEKHLEQIDQLSLSRVLLSRELSEANAEMRKWKARSTQLQCNMAQLKTEIEKLKLGREETKTKESPPKRVSKPLTIRSDLMINMKSEEPDEVENQNFDNVDVSRLIRKSEVDKENVNRNVLKEVTKKVQFSEDTVVPSVTNRNRLRRGATIIHVQSTHVPSIKKKAI